MVAEIEAQGGRIDALQKNLEEVPGHEASVQALANVYEGQGRYEDLTDMLSAQAAQMEAERARSLFERAASLAENRLNDDERALENYRRVVELSPSAEALEALARIHESRDEHAAAGRWLERRLKMSEAAIEAGEADAGSRRDISLRLAKALFAAERDERAAEVLEVERAADPNHAEVRDLLAEYYRRTESFGPLARLLQDAALHTEDGEQALPLVREAADLYCDRLGTPGEAIPVLARGVELDPNDKQLALRLADGQREAGQLDEARATLETLVASYGRRRSADRAGVHHRLGLVARDQGDLPRAIEQLELATKMAMASAPILQTLGDLAREAGDLDRAEKAYRTLLMAVRRRAPDAPVDVGVGEVLFELHAIADAREDSNQASELRESALEAAASSDGEALRFHEALVARGDAALALEGLERRVAGVEDTRENAESTGALRAAMGEVLSGALDRGPDGLAEFLKSLKANPAQSAVHDKARALAADISKSGEYASALEDMVKACRRAEDNALAGRLLLRLGAVLAEDQEQGGDAADAFRRAEEKLEDPTKAWIQLAPPRGRGRRRR